MTGVGETSGARPVRQELNGVVVSNKMEKTVVVAVERTFMHRLYHRYVKRTRRFSAHDEHNQCEVGDRVVIVSSRPISKNKRWRVHVVSERASG